MKISITFKTPDAIRCALQDHTAYEFEEEDEYEREERLDVLMEKFKRWVDYGEAIVIDFDLDAGTATVRDKQPKQSGSPVGLPGRAIGTGTVRKGKAPA